MVIGTAELANWYGFQRVGVKLSFSISFNLLGASAIIKLCTVSGIVYPRPAIKMEYGAIQLLRGNTAFTG